MKTKKYFHKVITKITSLFICCSMLLSNEAIVYAQDTKVPNSTTESLAEQIITTNTNNEQTYTGQGYSVEYAIKDSYGISQMIEVTLTNTGDTDINSFALKYPVKGEVLGLWGAEITDETGDKKTFNAPSYSKILTPNSSVTFGYRNDNGKKHFLLILFC